MPPIRSTRVTEARPALTFAMSFAYFAAGVGVASLILLDVVTHPFDQAMVLLIAGVAAFSSGWVMRGCVGPPIPSDYQ